MTSFNLEKGVSFDLTKAANGSLSKIHVGLGWNPAAMKPEADLDAIAILLNERQQYSDNTDIIFYGNHALKQRDGSFLSSDGAVHHMGDNLTGVGDGDDESITVDFSKLKNSIKSITFAVNIYDAINRKQTFGNVQNAYIRVVDTVSGKELCKYNLTGDFDKFTGVQFGSLNQDATGNWNFEAIGNGFEGSLNELFSFYK